MFCLSVQHFAPVGQIVKKDVDKKVNLLSKPTALIIIEFTEQIDALMTISSSDFNAPMVFSSANHRSNYSFITSSVETLIITIIFFQFIHIVGYTDQGLCGPLNCQSCY